MIQSHTAQTFDWRGKPRTFATPSGVSIFSVDSP